MKNLLKIFGLKSCKLIGRPMLTSQELSSKDETQIVEKNKYKSMIRCCNISLTRTRYRNTVGIEIFQEDIREKIYSKIKRIFRYWRVYLTFDYGMKNWVNLLHVHVLMRIDTTIWIIEKEPLVEHFFLEEDRFLL